MDREKKKNDRGERKEGGGDRKVKRENRQRGKRVEKQCETQLMAAVD